MAIYFFTIQVDFPGTFDGSNFFLSLSNAFPIAIFHENIRLSFSYPKKVSYGDLFLHY